MANSECIVLVPVHSDIQPACEQALHTLERRGYTVKRAGGFSAIDFGRSVLASNALDDGFEEILWVDSDIAFNPDDVEKLRAHALPLVCAIYAKKSVPEFACDFLAETTRVLFGEGGGLHEIRYAGCGFMLTRREVYSRMRDQLQLPSCNQKLGRPVVPYFLPMLVGEGEERRYLSEDYSFCERVRQCGMRVMCDSSIRLYHIGTYGFTWEDIGRRREQFASYTCNFDWQTNKR